MNSLCYTSTFPLMTNSPSIGSIQNWKKEVLSGIISLTFLSGTFFKHAEIYLDLFSRKVVW